MMLAISECVVMRCFQNNSGAGSRNLFCELKNLSYGINLPGFLRTGVILLDQIGASIASSCLDFVANDLDSNQWRGTRDVRAVSCSTLLVPAAFVSTRLDMIWPKTSTVRCD